MPYLQNFFDLALKRLAAFGPTFYRRRLEGFFLQKTNRIYILPSLNGVLYVILLTLILSVAMIERVHLTYFALAVATGLLSAGLVFTNYNLSKMKILSVRCHSAHVGEQARIVLRMRNNARQTRYNLNLVLPFDQRLTEFSTRTLDQIKPAQTAVIELTVPLTKRGRYEVPRVKLSTRFPFGLFYSWSWQKIDAVYFAYPMAKGDLPPPMVGAADRKDICSNDRNKESFGADFSGHKVYEFGDSLRHINWRLVARGYDPHVKQFSGSHFQMVKIDLDRLTNIDDPEERLSQVSKWIKTCSKNRLPFQIRLSAMEEYALVIHTDDLRVCLERLAAWKP